MLVRIFDPSHTATGDTSLIFFTLAKDGVQPDLTEKIFSIIPNPAKGYLILRTDAHTAAIQCEVVDELGIVRRQYKEMQYSSDGLKLELQGLSAGKYFLRVKGSGMPEKLLSFVVE